MNFPSSLQHDRAQRRTLLQRQPLPERLKDRLLLGQQPRQRPVEILERHLSRALRPYLIPRFMRKPLDVIGRFPASSTIASATPASGFMPVFTKRRSMKSANRVGEIFWSRMTGPCRRTTGTNHLFHQTWLGAGEDVADLPLVLGCGAQRVLDAAAIEAVDRLELVERDHDCPLPLGGEFAGQREHFVGQTIEVASGRDLRKRDGEAAEASFGS